MAWCSPRPGSALIAALAGAGCAPAGEGGRPLNDDPSSWCGVPAAMHYRQSRPLRDRPPACALPTAKEVESSCAIHDLVTAPGYRGPTYDDEGNIAAARDPAPGYKVSGLSCRFTSRRRNRAFCRFQLWLPQSPGTPVATTATFEHRFWEDHGPAHHLYGVRWSPTGRCTRAPG